MRFFFSSIFLFCFFITHGQQILFRGPCRGSILDLSALVLGDSIFLNYTENLVGGSTIAGRASWIRPDGSVSPDKHIKGLTDVVPYGSDLYYYYFEETKETVKLRASVQKIGLHQFFTPENSIDLPEGSLIGSFKKGNIFLVTINNKTNEIIITEIEKLDVISQKRYALPFKISDFYSNSDFAALFEANSPLSTFYGYQPFKVIIDSAVQMVFDLPKRKPGGSVEINETLVLTPAENNQLKITTLKADKPVVKPGFQTGPNRVPAKTIPISSYVIDGKLFRVYNSAKLYKLTVTDIATDSIISTKELKSETENFKGYIRYGRENGVSDRQTVSSIMRATTSTAILNVTSTAPGKYIIQWGTYYDDNGVGPVILNPIGLLVTVVWTAANQLRPGPGIARYFYYEWDAFSNTYRPIENASDFLRIKIDDYEIADIRNNDAHIRFKEYIEYRNGVLAIYHDKKKEEIKLVYFE
jgi:hypothetical protein